MSYQVIARKWRPQEFDGVIFQDHVSRTIKNGIKKGRISHAFLFSGPRGVGKTTMARILARALNCVNGPTESPCGVCEHCTEIRAGNSFDVIEIDGASNSGVDHIRELRENVNFAPAKCRYKVYIIDEVHMLSREAFNALLKTLEEPPAHIVFVFATTEFHRIPETILSRCQKFFFKKISIDAIVAHLASIVKAEGFSIDPKALYPVARAADGSMRDAQSLLDQMLSFAEGEVGEEDALAILGVVPLGSYLLLLETMSAGGRREAVMEVDRVIELGVDIARYAAGLVDAIRALRLVKNGIAVQELLGYSAEETAAITALAGRFVDEELSGIFRIGSDLLADLRTSANERINLEMALLDMIALKNAPSIAALLKMLDEGGPIRPSAGDAKSAPANPAAEKSAPAKPARPAEARAPRTDEKLLPKKQSNAKAAPQGVPSDAQMRAAWRDLIKEIETTRSFLHFNLKEARVELRDRTLAIIFPEGGGHEYNSRVLDRAAQDFIKEELLKRTGFEAGLFVTSGPRVREEEPAIEEAPPPPEAEMIMNPETDEIKMTNPVVEKVRDAFSGKILEKGDE
ncbi:MAG: DNA polymerase III subunit gamma/tau [Spirochaetes bacterium]|nr:MAG: DNA polymerase III subunit gamma/tau [Spirochaetota bacterium]